MPFHQFSQMDLHQLKVVFLRRDGRLLGQDGGVVDHEIVGHAIGIDALQDGRPAGGQARPDHHDPLERGLADQEVGRAAVFAIGDRLHARNRRGEFVGRRPRIGQALLCGAQPLDRRQFRWKAAH